MASWKLRVTLSCSSALCSAIVAGCGVERVQPDPVDRPSPYEAPAAGVRDGRLVGQVGPAWVDALADPLHAYSAMSTLRVVGASLQDERAVTLQVTLRTDDIALVPGTHERFSADDAGSFVLLGRVGQSLDIYDELDRPADEVELTVEPAPGGGAGDVSVQLDGVWWPAGQVGRDPSTAASFSFVVVR